MHSFQELPFSCGKFLISPSARVTDAGDYEPSVSLRRGQGSGTHDKIYRFTPRFASRMGAIDYAIGRGRALAKANGLICHDTQGSPWPAKN